MMSQDEHLWRDDQEEKVGVDTLRTVDMDGLQIFPGIVQNQACNIVEQQACSLHQQGRFVQHFIS